MPVDDADSPAERGSVEPDYRIDDRRADTAAPVVPHRGQHRVTTGRTARPLVTTPSRLLPHDVRRAEGNRLARQPGLAVMGGLLFVLPLAVVLAYGVGGAEGSVRVLSPLTTFALPVVALIAFWWEDWPGTRLRSDWTGWVDTVLVLIGAIILTMAGQAVTARLDLVGIFDPGAGPEHSATFPATLPLAGAGFVMMLQLTLACERWPFRRFNRTLSGLLALVVSAVVAVVSTWTVVAVTEPVAGASVRPGLMGGADFGAMIVTIAVWQTVVFVVLRGWPLNLIEARVPRLLANNATVIAGGLLTYWVLSSGSGLEAETINSVCGCVIAGGLLVGMLFEGWPPWARRWGTLALVAVVSAALFALLTGIADMLSWQRATPSDWVSYTTLNAVGLAVLLHVGIGRRWPFHRIPEERK
jgi:hypothetical protein